MNTFRQGVGRNLIGVLGCLVLGGLLFAAGYLVGERQGKSALAAKGIIPSSPGSPSQISAMHPMLPAPNPPADATPEMKEFMKNRATLADKMAQLRSQGTNGAPDAQAFAKFQKDNADLLKRQNELSHILAQQQAQKPIPEPPPLNIPPNASPQLQAFLTARDAIMRDQINLMNQNRTSDPKTRQAAMQDWQQKNADRLKQLRELAQALAKTN